LSREWIKRRKGDEYYRRAKNQGYRSRSAFKLRQMNKRARFIRGGDRVLDLGAAPGGWSQVARELVGEKGYVLAVDLQRMGEIEGVESIVGDIEEPNTIEDIRERCAFFDVVISDASVNLSGNRTFDRGRNLSLCRAVLKTAGELLTPGGSCLVKVFSGPEIEELKEEFGPIFKGVDHLKPSSSLKRSSELYLLFRGRSA